MPAACAIVFSSMWACASCSGHGGWWISARCTAAVDHGVQAVALGQEVLERAGRGVEDRADGPVANAQARNAVDSCRLVAVSVSPRACDRHARPEVGQVVGRARSGDGRPAGGVEAEEVDAWSPVEGGVGAHVDLWEPGEHGRQERPRRRSPVTSNGVTPIHAWPSKVSIGSTSGTPAPRSVVRGNRPVGEEQVAPGLALQPRALGQGPGPVRALAQRARCARAGEPAPASLTTAASAGLSAVASSRARLGVTVGVYPQTTARSSPVAGR